MNPAWASGWIGVASFGSAGLAFLLFSGLLLLNSPSSSRSIWISIASLFTAAWGFTLAYFLATPPLNLPAIIIADALHIFVWLVFALQLMSVRNSRGVWSTRAILALIAAALLVIPAIALFIGEQFPQLQFAALLALLGLAFLGLVAIEQVYRNADSAQRRVLGLFCIALGLVFVFELFVWSDAVLLRSLSPDLWAARGILAALVAPMLLVAAKRHPEWEDGLFISRQAVFYSASTLGAGFYLLTMAIGGYVIRQAGGVWGAYLQLLFFVLAGILLAVALFSAHWRARFKVFIAKHFFKNRYDYREQWLKLIQTLSEDDASTPINKRSIKSLAQIIDSDGGVLWLRDDSSGHFEYVTNWGHGVPASRIDNDNPLIRFIDSKRWIVDTKAEKADPEAYGNHFSGSDGAALPPNVLLIPLQQQTRLIGIVELRRPTGLGALNFEDHDLLKTAGRQVAVFLAQDLAQEHLTRTRQFEAFNKLTAFLMHDLKNLIAQQAMVVSNARRFKHDPEFIDDAIKTIESGVQRMKRVLTQLELGREQSLSANTEVSKLLLELVSNCADRKPIPSLHKGPPVWINTDRDKLLTVLTHAIRNAQDATPPSGRIDVSVAEADKQAVIEISDTGCGMSEEFIRNRLFQPFDSTKGSQGMGIGVYQLREFVLGVGGRLEVTSEPGNGSCFQICLPSSKATDRLVKEADETENSP